MVRILEHHLNNPAALLINQFAHKYIAYSREIKTNEDENKDILIAPRDNKTHILIAHRDNKTRTSFTYSSN